jgi:hypothetical protein
VHCIGNMEYLEYHILPEGECDSHDGNSEQDRCSEMDGETSGIIC